MLGRALKHFTVEEILGQGGMGVVYRARDTKLQRPVALKVLLTEVTIDAEKRKRFFQEARAAARISHPAIAQVYDVDEADGIVYIAMELVEGKTVRNLIQSKELDVLGAIDIAIQVAEGLAKAHEAGIVHRDIKPANVILSKDGHAKILDFGLAKLMDQAAPASATDSNQANVTTLTQSRIGTVMGTAAYMSPEQVRAGPIDGRSDIFSLGAMLFEMVTWEMPFRRGNTMETMQAVAFEETPSIHNLRSNLPPELQRIVSKCMRKRTEDRYVNATEMVRDLKLLQRETETGRYRALPIQERLAQMLERMRHLQPKEYLWLAVGLVGTALVLYLTISGVSKTNVLPFALICLFLYRYVRNRPRKILQEFVRKASRLPEVQLISSVEGQMTVIVDRPTAQLYGRINQYIHNSNTQLFFGKPMSAVIRYDVSPEDLQTILRSPNVHYVREDALKS